MNVWLPDDCCGPHLAKASNAGELDAINEWACPECGCRWTAQMVGPMKHWTAQPRVEIF